MSIKSLILYGSCARKDDDSSSDVDILAISDEPSYRSSSVNKTNLSVYPHELALSRAKGGDLFMLHIIREGQEIYDSGNVLKELRESFKYKSDYSSEVSQASDLGWFLLNWVDSLSDFSLFNKRIAWCVRTILIARSAEQRTPVFSAIGLAAFSGRPEYVRLIKVKNKSGKDELSVSMFRCFLDEFGSPLSREILSANLSDQKEYFSETGNKIAELTAESFIKGFCSVNYS